MDSPSLKLTLTYTPTSRFKEEMIRKSQLNNKEKEKVPIFLNYGEKILIK